MHFYHLCRPTVMIHCHGLLLPRSLSHGLLPYYSVMTLYHWPSCHGFLFCPLSRPSSIAVVNAPSVIAYASHLSWPPLSRPPSRRPYRSFSVTTIPTKDPPLSCLPSPSLIIWIDIQHNASPLTKVLRLLCISTCHHSGLCTVHLVYSLNEYCRFLFTKQLA
jgi:hypothetical protein